MALVCVVSAGHLRAELRVRRRVRWAAEVEWSSPSELETRVAELVGRTEVPAHTRSVRFEIAPSICQVRSLAGLPAVPTPDLLRLLRHAPHRYFRRADGALTIDGGWVGRGRGRRVVAAALPETLGQALLRGARGAGLVVESIAPMLAERACPLSLMPLDEAARRSSQAWRRTRWLTIAAFTAWLALLGGAILRQTMERRRIAARLEELRIPLAAVLAAEAERDSAMAMIRRIDAEQQHEGDAVATLFRLTLALPDSSFLTQVRVDSGGVGLVAGAAPRSAAVLAALELRAHVATPRFEGRTSRDVVDGAQVERFAIGFGEAHP